MMHNILFWAMSHNVIKFLQMGHQLTYQTKQQNYSIL